MTPTPNKPTKTLKRFASSAREFVQDHTTVLVLVAIPVLLVCCQFGVAACVNARISHDSASNTSATSSQSTKAKSTENTSGKPSSTSSTSSKNTQTKAADPVDPDWPTRNATLLAIPESERYYNAYKYVGERHRVVGPVVSVNYAAQSNGQPTFIDIGKPYPSDERFTLVIWGEDMDEDLYEMVTAVQNSNAWLSVEGTIETYKGLPEIQTGRDSFTYQYWTFAN